MDERELIVSQRELHRIHVVRLTLEGRESVGRGAEFLGISTRQMKRLRQKMRERGMEGLLHGNRGKRAWNRTAPEKVKRVLQLVPGGEPGLLQENRQVLEKMVSALVEGKAFSLAPGNKAVVVKTMMKYLRTDDPGLAEQGYQDVLLSLSRKPYPSIEGVRNMQRLMALYNPKMASVRAEDLVDSSFVSKLDESGLMDRLLSAYGPQ